MLKLILVALLSFNMFFSNTVGNLPIETKKNTPGAETGTLEKMIVSNGSVAMELDLNRLNGTRQTRGKQTKSSELRFEVEPNSFFTIMVFNNELRDPLPGTMALLPQSTVQLPAKMSASYSQLVIENAEWGGQYSLVVRDAKSGFTFFNIEGHEFDYEGGVLSAKSGRLLLSKEFADSLGRSSEAGSIIGNISIKTNMRAIEVVQVVNGEVKSETMPAMGGTNNAGTVPGPDVVVGDLSGLAQFGASSGTQVGLAVGTDSCNFGTVNLNWFQNPNNDHPVIPQNLYRQSGGTDNAERFEQVGQSQVKHAFTALRNNICNLGCNGVGDTQLGSGCSDPYSANLNAGPNLGSRAWINPFTGFYPRGEGATNNNSHAGHTHTGTSHRILTEIADLNTTLNPGATYFAEAQYITPHEYAHCVANPGQCNMNNNVSYRQYNVSGTGSPFSFSPAASTVRQKAAITAWVGASTAEIKPDPANDGVGTVAWKVTNPSPGVWHYEYAIYNQNLDRAIQSFSVPLGNGITISNVGFHAPPQHPGWANDGTVGNAGFSSTPWASANTGGAITWSSETFAQNQNANAIRWGTMYNFRFDSNRPPETKNTTIGFYKTGAPITVQMQAPSAVPLQNVSIEGRVLTSSGQGIGNISVALTDAGGNLVGFATTSSFGFYRFENVVPGSMYTVEPLSKRFSFNAATRMVTDNIVNLNFSAAPQ